VFDIGAHVGDRTASFARLGASVVALEPQRDVFRALRLILGRTPNVILRNEAVGATQGLLKLYVNAANPTVSTGSKDLIAAAKTAATWQGQSWDTTTQVPMTTLDLLIQAHGMPDFVKIDVEGFELEVLKGLSIALPLFSFEFTTIQRDIAQACLAKIATLGDYVFNFSLGEDHRLHWDAWKPAGIMHNMLANLQESANSGDVFVKLTRKPDADRS